MFELPLMLVVIVIVALIFDFTNGAHDCANAIATVVSTKVLTPKTAVLMAACLNMLGAMMGTEVASTLGKGIVNTEMVAGCQGLVLAALIGATAWNFITWGLGIPSSSSHALIGGLMGAAITYAGFESLNLQVVVMKILLPLVAAPLAGFLAGFVFMTIIVLIFANRRRAPINRAFSRLQILSSALAATSHGLNDAQKTMGVITLALFIFGEIETVTVPFWVKFACASIMALGTATGGWKIIKTMGHKIFKMEPVHGFASETSAALVITASSLVGAPVSTTHTITACIFGVGCTKRASAVRWNIAGNLFIAWCITIPASGFMSMLTFMLLYLAGLA